MTDRRSAWLAPRRRVVITSIALLALLDLGRSIFARVGYARPLSIWQPDPKVYADLTWPPGADLPANTPAGPRTYARRCATLLCTLGIVGTGLLAIPTLSGSAAYAVAEVFGWREGIGESFRRGGTGLCQGECGPGAVLGTHVRPAHLPARHSSCGDHDRCDVRSGGSDVLARTVGLKKWT